jgi:hypothetical protein
MQLAHQALGICFHMEFLRFTPPLCNYSCSLSTWDLQFSSASQLGLLTAFKDLYVSRVLYQKKIA